MEMVEARETVFSKLLKTMEIKQPLELLGTHLTSRWWMDSRASRIYYLKENRDHRRRGAQRSEARKIRRATGVAFHEVVNRQRRRGSPWPFASSQSRSSPRAFTGFDEKAPSRCVNHEPLRRFFESHPHSEETEPKRRRRDSTVRSESFLRARIHTPRATLGVPRFSAPRCNFIAESRISRQAARRLPIFRKPRTRATFAPPSIAILPVSSLM